MAQPKRSDAEFVPPSARPASEPAVDHGYRPGGEVGRMHADLSHRLAGPFDAPSYVSPEEPVVRFLSVAGGYVALAAGYAITALLLLR